MNTEWLILAGILFAIGILFDIINIGTYISNRKGSHVSGVPFLGGLFFAASLLVFRQTRPFFLLGLLLDTTVYSVPSLIADSIKAHKYKDRFRIYVLAENGELPVEDRIKLSKDRIKLLEDRIKPSEERIKPDEEGKEQDSKYDISELESEHGLSFYIEHQQHNFLLDAGQSDLFARNADKMGIDLSKVDAAILSHAHYDHADGLAYFFDRNRKAKLYVRKEAGERYYSEHTDGMKYIGPKKGMLDRYKDRIVYVDGEFQPVFSWGDVLIPHNTKGLEEIGLRSKLFKEENGQMVPDDFSHEQTLIMMTPKGIVLINSCSHGGVSNIIREAGEYLCKENAEIYAYIGGFHLKKASDEEIYRFAESLKDAKVKRFITGHCTGMHAISILQKELGEKVEVLYPGMVIE